MIASILIIIIIASFLSFSIIKKFPICYSIIIANFIIFIITPLFYPLINVIDVLAFKPSYIMSYKIYTIITSMFLHAGILHIIGNMIVLFLIGIPFEYRVGMKIFALVYFMGGIVGNLFYSVAKWGNSFLIGASGAIFSILGAFAVKYPRDEIILPFIVTFVRMKVVTAAILLSLFQIFFISAEELFLFEGHIAYFAHLGGLVGGVLIAILLSLKKVEMRTIDYNLLEKFAVSQKQKEILKRIRDADLPEVKEAWLTEFLKCPKCSKKMEINRKKMICKNCGFKIEITAKNE